MLRRSSASRLAPALSLALAAAAAMIVSIPSGPAHADDSKLERSHEAVSARDHAPGRPKICCGYPLSEDLGFALRFYWLAMEERHADDFSWQDVYTEDGFFLGAYPEKFVRELRMEGSGVLADGRVINYAGRCDYGVGTCFHQLDSETHPYGRGAGRRALRPFRSVAVDPTLVAIGEPLYIPEFDGILLPDGTIHDGCVRADDTGSAIKKRKMDFFVLSRENFRYLLGELWGVIWITPHIETPRCQYMRES